MDEVYARLMKRMDEFPMGAPETDNLLELLKLVFNPEEAEMALLLPSMPTDIGAVAADLGRDPEELLDQLEGMSQNGLVFIHTRKDGSKTCNLLPLLPGIFEMQFMKGEVSPTKRQVAELFDKYYYEGWGRTSFSSDTPMARVLPVEEEIPRKDQVLPYEKISSYLKESTSIALTTCFCRHEAELLGKACDAPKDVCMALGPFADFLAERGFARKVTVAEALDALDRAEKAGLVHITDNVQDKITFICSCCGCCCGFLGTITRLNMEGTIAPSPFHASVDADLCNGCEACVEVCQMKAIRVDGTASIDDARCIGCGLCASHCPSDAVIVSEREGWKEPLGSIVDLNMSILKERGRL